MLPLLLPLLQPAIFRFDDDNDDLLVVAAAVDMIHIQFQSMG